MKFLNKHTGWQKGAAIFTGMLVISANVFAQGAPQKSELNNPLAITLIIVMTGLLLAIGLLAYVVIGAARVYVDRLKIEKQKIASSVESKVVALIALCLVTTSVFAADTPAAAEPVAVANYGGLSKFSFYALLTGIGLELLILLTLALFLKRLLAKEHAIVAEAQVEAKKKFSLKEWWAKMNSFKPVTEEKDITLDHDYDGIRELDNRLPPWWLYGFYICIFFAVVYIYRFHISHTGPSSKEEYAAAMLKADAEKEEYLKSAANKVDENSVTLLTDPAALAEGKKIFTTTCSPCHGAEGQGVVGPNLTDDYWMHKGGVKDVFKTIKYGVPEKGMKSWKDDFSPVQIAQLASFIKSLHGSKPANPKEPQGEIYKDEQSASQPADTTKLAAH